jgi:hypothetical protein
MFSKFRTVGKKPAKKIPKDFEIVGKKPATTKLPAQKSPKPESVFDDLLKKSQTNKLRNTFGVGMDKSFYERPPLISLSQERASKIGRRVESSALQRMSKIRSAAASRIKAKRAEFGIQKTKFFTRTNNGLKPTPFAKKVKAKISSLQTRAFKLAERKGIRATEKVSQRLDIPMSKPKDRPVSFYSKKQDVRESLTKREKSIDMGFVPKGFYNYKNEGNYLRYNINQRRSIYKEASKRREQYKRKK